MSALLFQIIRGKDDNSESPDLEKEAREGRTQDDDVTGQGACEKPSSDREEMLDGMGWEGRAWVSSGTSSEREPSTPQNEAA